MGAGCGKRVSASCILTLIQKPQLAGACGAGCLPRAAALACGRAAFLISANCAAVQMPLCNQASFFLSAFSSTHVTGMMRRRIALKVLHPLAFGPTGPRLRDLSRPGEVMDKTARQPLPILSGEVGAQRRVSLSCALRTLMYETSRGLGLRPTR